MVQLMVEAGMIKPEEAATHPDANKIMRALGIAPTVEVDLRPEPLPFGPGDAFVLASDGLTDLVTEAEILQMVGTLPPEQAAGQMVDLANARGGHDNITVVVARMREGSHAHASKTSSKTVPVTAVDPVDVGRASPATVLAAPLPLALPQGGAPATALAPPLVGVGPAVVPPVASAPRPFPSEPHAAEPRGLSPALVVAVIVVALAVLAGIGYAIYGQLQRTKHKDPEIIVPLGALGDAGSSAPTPDPDPEPTGSEPPPETPPLAVPPPPKPHATQGPHSPHKE
jgi:protein phosphatase